MPKTIRPLPHLTPKDIQRFSKYVDVRGPDECWPWKGATISGKYGVFRVSNANVLAHRASYFVHLGNPGSLYVCHRCDSPTCCNPAHLFLGTQRDNMQDMTSKGRRAFKLTPLEVGQIRYIYSHLPIRQSDLGELFGVHNSHVSRIVRGKQRVHC